MVCIRSTDDPIARLVSKQDGFVLLDRGYEPSVLFPGLVFRKPFGSSKRPSVPVRGESMIAGWPELVPAVFEYRRLARGNVTSKMTGAVAASVSGLLTGDPNGSAEVNTELKKASVSHLVVGLDGAVVRNVDVAKLEDALPECTLTELGDRYRDRSDRLFVVYETLNVTGANLLLDESVSASTFVSATAAVLGRLGIKGRADGNKAHSVVLDKTNEDEVVIAVRALEINWSDPANIILSSPPTKWPFRGGQDAEASEDTDVPTLDELEKSYKVAGLDDFGQEGMLFVEFDAHA